MKVSSRYHCWLEYQSFIQKKHPQKLLVDFFEDEPPNSAKGNWTS